MGTSLCSFDLQECKLLGKVTHPLIGTDKVKDRSLVTIFEGSDKK